MQIVIIILAILLFAVIFLLSINPRYKVQRSKVFRVSNNVLFDEIFDLQKFISWNPWLLHEPDAKITFSHDGEGKTKKNGEWYSWDGNTIGAGSITNTSHSKGKNGEYYIEQALTFIRPYASDCYIRWDIKQHDNGVQLTWTMHGKMPRFMAFMAKKMDAMLGKDFVIGLDLLASKLHGEHEMFSVKCDEKQTFKGGKYVCIAYSGTVASLPQILPGMYTSLHQAIGDQIHHQLPAIAVYKKYRVRPEPSVDMLACLAVDSTYQLDEKAQQAGMQIEHIRLHGTYAVTRLIGKYVYLSHAWHIAMGHVRMQKNKPRHADMYEVYCTMDNDAPQTNTTEILIPIR